MIELIVHMLLTRQETEGELSRTIYVQAPCEQCGHEYGYALTRSVEVRVSRAVWENAAQARRKARDCARELLKRRLDRACEPVPCPECGWYQSRMRAAARREQRAVGLPPSARRAFLLGGVAFVLMGAVLLSPAVGGPRWLNGEIAFLLSFFLLYACGVLAFFFHLARSHWQDPNATPVETRIAHGQQRSLTWEEFQERYGDAEDDEEP